MMLVRQVYSCPKHPEIRKLGPGTCPTCEASLVREGASFAVARHVVEDPLMLLQVAGLVTLAMSVIALIQMMRG
jgi:Heavy metal binding domain